MVPIPDFLKKFIPEAQKLLSHGNVRDIEFSQATYQIKVLDPKLSQECWAFIQLNPNGLLQDAFCSCEEEEQIAGCSHIAAALLRIYSDPSSPLHDRFENSLWNRICHLFREHFGDRPSIKSQRKTLSFHPSLHFSFEHVSLQKQLIQMVEKRPQETEETSLKFSNLSEEELSMWREGKPGEELKYELSFWGDLAKSMLIDQDEGRLKEISFSYNTKGIPTQITVLFTTYSFTYTFQKGDLEQLVLGLANVVSPLKVFNRLQDFASSVTYDEKAGEMKFEAKPFLKNIKESIEIPNWYYFPRIGFYPREPHEFVKEKSLKGDQIQDALNKNAAEIAALLKNCIVYLQPVEVKHSLQFDKEFNLHITPYVVSPGDLSMPFSRLFGEWAYIEKLGFYRLYGLRYPSLSTTIKEKDVPDFIRRESSWLDAQKGFKIHLQSLESQISFCLDESGRLSFERKISVENPKLRTKDFGPWIYVEEDGFYTKSHMPISLPLQAGVSIGPEQIPGFIHLNRAELELVAGFFCTACPFIEAGLNISLSELGSIEADPFFQIKPEFLGKRLKFFDDIVYVEGEGFFELPLEMRLPEKFRTMHIIQGEGIKSFLNQEIEKIRPFVHNIDQRLERPAFLHLAVKSIRKTAQGYSLQLFYRTDKGTIALSQILQSYRQKQPFLFSEAGLIDLESSRFNWFKGIKESQVDFLQNEIMLSSVELIRLHAIEELLVQGENAKVLKDLLDYEITEPVNLIGLKSILRPYQEKGVQWLYSLYNFSLSGLLCDDMGLGKTHQAMGLFAAVQNQMQGKKATFLVVCPTSVLYHWQEKLQEFLPRLKVLTFHGTKRKELFTKDFDLLLTSYGILRNEIELFKELKFSVAVFDEIQVAKNHNSRLYASLLHVKAAMRLGLTGTPIENRLRELKALFDIILPLYMPSDAEYSKQYVRPIEREHNMQEKQKLARLIKPFILRRRKGDVLLDLPDKTEEIAHCDLHPEQAKLYREVLLQGRERVLPDLKDSTKIVPYIHIFALLSHLKQVLDHPALFLKQVHDYKKFHSGKWDLFVELLQEARESEQKIVVFSQYLGMLDIIENYLKAKGIGFAGIRGSTKDRSEQIKLFHTDPKCEVFVASLKAAGLGIDLTPASVVIHYDRWWNKAREDQATDRVHRIGQHQGVQVFKLVTKNSFEERIHELIERKGQLMEEVVGVDDHEVLKRFTREELMQLLQDIQ